MHQFVDFIKKVIMSKANSLESLKAYTIVAADTGNYEIIRKFKASDATTNPSLILEAANEVQYRPLIKTAAQYGEKNGNSMQQQSENAKDMLTVLFGIEILNVVGGRVSVQIDPRLAFEREASISKARKLIKLFADQGICKDRVLIKLPATWEGIQAAKELEATHGIHCNLTLLFNFSQAVACADAGVTMVAPFVGGRLLGLNDELADNRYRVTDDEGINLASNIYNYYKKFHYKTVVMGAYLRNTDQIRELAGCDYLTISPKLLEELQDSNIPVHRNLSVEKALTSNVEKIEITESKFRWMMNEDKTGDALSDGIRIFTNDSKKLDTLIAQYLSKA